MHINMPTSFLCNCEQKRKRTKVRKLYTVINGMSATTVHSCLCVGHSGWLM